MRKQLDWTATRERAERMDKDQLQGAINDCRRAAEAAEKLDRAGLIGHGAKDGGYYSDEASVYRAEQHRRNGIRRKQDGMINWRFRVEPIGDKFGGGFNSAPIVAATADEAAEILARTYGPDRWTLACLAEVA